MMDRCGRDSSPRAPRWPSVLGLLTAGPARPPTRTRASRSPDGTSEFYSPFSGPATVTFTFDADRDDATFELRLRPLGGTAIHTKQVFIDPDTQTSPRDVYVLVAGALGHVGEDVPGRRLSGRQPPGHARELPTASAPRDRSRGRRRTRSCPWIDDGYKDDDDGSDSPSPRTPDAEARVFKANSSGKCCGSLIRNDDLGSLGAGANQWDWDGQGEGSFAGNRPAGQLLREDLGGRRDGLPPRSPSRRRSRSSGPTGRPR